MNAIPHWITERLQPASKPLLQFKRVSYFNPGIVEPSDFA
jgi:hypothetical protein